MYSYSFYCCSSLVKCRARRCAILPFRCRVVSRGAEDEDVDEEGGEVDEEGAVEEEASVAGSVLGGSTLAMLETADFAFSAAPASG